LNLTRLDLLIYTRLNSHIEDVIIAIWCVKHFWCIVRVLFLSHTHVNANVGITERVIFERDVQFLIISHPRSYALFVKGNFDVEILEIIIRWRLVHTISTFLLMD